MWWWLMRDESAAALREFFEVVEMLRAPGGCPWDRDQTHKTLAPYLIEEAYELLDAINDGDMDAMREELGDVLFQVFIHSAIAAESGDEGFDIGDVADQVKSKMVHRHPHVFGDTEVRDAADVVVNWEKLKAAEKEDRDSLLDGIPRSLPSLSYAQAVQKRPARLGLDEWRDHDHVATELRTIVDELQAAARDLPAPRPGQDWVIREGEIAKGSDAGDAQPAEPTDAMADLTARLLWSAVAMARLMRVNAEDALRQAADEFAGEFRAREKAAKESGMNIHEMRREEWDRIKG
jgi:MazG family protein